METCAYCDTVAFVKITLTPLDHADVHFNAYQCQKCHLDFMLWNAEKQGRLEQVEELLKDFSKDG